MNNKNPVEGNIIYPRPFEQPQKLPEQDEYDRIMNVPNGMMLRPFDPLPVPKNLSKLPEWAKMEAIRVESLMLGNPRGFVTPDQARTQAKTFLSRLASVYPSPVIDEHIRLRLDDMVRNNGFSTAMLSGGWL